MRFTLTALALPLLAAAKPPKRSQISFASDAGSDMVLNLPATVLPAFEWLTIQGIKPSSHATYTLAELQGVAHATFGEDAIWHCVSGVLSSVFWSDESSLKSSCPDFGIKWLPEYKEMTVVEPPTGEVIIQVVNATTGVATGCLKDNGMWSIGACGVFNVTSFNETVVDNSTYWLSAPNNFTLTSLAGPCTAAFGTFSCKAVTIPSYFQSDLDTSYLAFNGTSDFFAPFTPFFPGMSLPILTAGKAGMVNISLEFLPAPSAPPAL